MPQVPTYDTRQVAPGGQLPGFESVDIRQQGQLVRNAENPGLQQANSNILGVLGEMQQRRNVELVTKAEAQLVELDNEFRRGAGEKLGENAHGITQEAEKFWGEIPRKLGEGFENDQQRRVFEAVVQRRRSASMDAVASHEAKQSRVATLQTAEASGNAHLSSIAGIAASGTWDDVNRATVRAELEDGLAAIEVGSKAAGLPEAARAAARLAYTTKAHAEVIQGLADRDPEAAAEYFNTHRDQIDGSAHAKLQKVLEIGGAEVEAQNVVDRLMSEGTSLADGLAYIEKNYSGKREEFFKDRLEARFGEQARAAKQAGAAAYAPVLRAITDAERAGAYITSAQQSAILKPLMTNGMEAEYEDAVRKIVAHNRGLDADARARESHRASLQNANSREGRALNWLQLKYLMMNNPDKYKSEDAAADIFEAVRLGQLNASDAEEALKMQTEIRKGKTQDFASLLTAEQHMNNRLRGVTVGGTAYLSLAKTDQDSFKARALQAAERELQRFQQNNGKKATDAEIKQIIDSLFISKQYKDGVWGTDGGVRQEMDEQGATSRVNALTLKKRVDEMPASTRKRIVDAMIKNNVPVTDAAILDYYNAGVK